jgi:hypothetical protein
MSSTQAVKTRPARFVSIPRQVDSPGVPAGVPGQEGEHRAYCILAAMQVNTIAIRSIILADWR